VIILAVAQFFSVFLVTLSFRYCAKGRIGATLAVDALLFTLQFAVLKRVVDASTVAEAIGYVAGSLLGTLAGMLYTKGLKDETE
jgi:hypothetical protein